MEARKFRIFFDELKADLLKSLKQAYKDIPMDINDEWIQFYSLPKADLGDLAIGSFPLAKNLEKNPVQIALEWSKHIESPLITEINPSGPYLNI